MEAIKKQATKLREQVAKQQQAILRQLGHLGHESVMVDDAELEIDQRLQELYISTRAAKHVYGSLNFQLDLAARKLADNCYKYGGENQNNPSTLPKAAVEFGTSHAAMEDQREIMLGFLGQQYVKHIYFTYDESILSGVLRMVKFGERYFSLERLKLADAFSIFSSHSELKVKL
ncbi:SH3 domain-containing protein 1-like [Lycium barbarum]|uniref:SH3 domain-containing protein 1-like n=1 Tax=Lycium barbarum TaxID=112863 RepID=UPI00293E86AC|nr:SH3 domain-containing protein 1-like [Lycium barbarum]